MRKLNTFQTSLGQRTNLNKIRKSNTSLCQRTYLNKIRKSNTSLCQTTYLNKMRKSNTPLCQRTYLNKISKSYTVDNWLNATKIFFLLFEFLERTAKSIILPKLVRKRSFATYIYYFWQKSIRQRLSERANVKLFNRAEVKYPNQSLYWTRHFMICIVFFL